MKKNTPYLIVILCLLISHTAVSQKATFNAGDISGLREPMVVNSESDETFYTIYPGKSEVVIIKYNKALEELEKRSIKHSFKKIKNIKGTGIDGQSIYLYRTFYSQTDKKLTVSVYTFDLESCSAQHTTLLAIQGKVIPAVQNNRLYLFSYNQFARRLSITSFLGTQSDNSTFVSINDLKIGIISTTSEPDKLREFMHRALTNLKFTHFDNTTGNDPMYSREENHLYIYDKGVLLTSRSDNKDNRQLHLFDNKDAGIYLLNIPFEDSEEPSLQAVTATFSTRFGSIFHDGKLFIIKANEGRFVLNGFSLPKMKKLFSKTVNVSNFTQSVESYYVGSSANKIDGKKFLKLMYKGEPALGMHTLDEDTYWLEVVAFDTDEVGFMVGNADVMYGPALSIPRQYELAIPFSKENLQVKEMENLKKAHKKAVFMTRAKSDKNSRLIALDNTYYRFSASKSDKSTYIIRTIE